jgi:thymidylate synthase (FAD)
MPNIIEPKVQFITKTPMLAETIEHATRTCYKSHDLTKEGSAERLFNQIVKQSHHDSVSEHASVTVHITTDRATMAQFTRHRIGFAYSIESQRYCNYTKDKFGNEVSFVRPRGLKEGSGGYIVWYYAMKAAENYYFELLKEKVKPETARYVLPNSTKVEMTVTGNIRAWRNFFKLRADGHAQIDIRHLSKLIYDQMIENGVPKFIFDDISFEGAAE